MEPLIYQLRREHGKIMYQLGQVHQDGLLSPAGKRAFALALELLTQHLQREDLEFYPILKKLAQEDETLHTLLQEALDEASIPTLREQFHTLQDQMHSGDTPDEANLTATFHRLQGSFLQRIRWEENAFFPRFLTIWQRLHTP